MDSHPYTVIVMKLPFAPHEEVQGRQTKLHPGFTLDKLEQPPQVSKFFEIPTLFCPSGLNDVLQNFLIQCRAVGIVYFYIFAFSYKNKKMAHV